MARYAVVNGDGLVENVVLWDEDESWDPPENTTVISVEGTRVGPGWTYNNGEWVEPPPLDEEII